MNMRCKKSNNRQTRDIVRQQPLNKQGVVGFFGKKNLGPDEAPPLQKKSGPNPAVGKKVQLSCLKVYNCRIL